MGSPSADKEGRYQRWAADRGQVLDPTTLRKLVGMLRSVFADAVLDRRVAAKPAGARQPAEGRPVGRR